MKVLVDTSVWSIALRHSRVVVHGEAVTELRRLIAANRVLMIGPIRQELLSGIRREDQFEVLRDKLRAFPDQSIGSEVFELAARAFNACRTRGVQGSNTDFLLCAVALRSSVPVFTTDRDFEAFRDILGIRLHIPEKV